MAQLEQKVSRFDVLHILLEIFLRSIIIYLSNFRSTGRVIQGLMSELREVTCGRSFRSATFRSDGGQV